LNTTPKIKHGEIWLANLNPTRGTEAGKCRPVLILQNQALLDVFHPSTIIIPLTTNLIDDAEPLRLRIKAQGQLEKNSDLLIDQIRAIDNKHLIKGPLAQCKANFLEKVHSAVCEVMNIRAYSQQHDALHSRHSASHVI
jgi:mRNA interferase MazF